ncbi:MAG TPA: hypothetical protein VMR41_02360 [Patescibacteria group bacterium]|nr:hypothetical protein [Patescibacteria group bacterium]
MFISTIADSAFSVVSSAANGFAPLLLGTMGFIIGISVVIKMIRMGY